MIKHLKLQPETLDLFIDLEFYYAEKGYLISGHERSINHHNISRLEQKLELHCREVYHLPWYRVYSFWRVSVFKENALY